MFLAAATSGADPVWWQLMLQYGLAPTLVALISTAALLIQNKANNDREDRRRSEETAEREKDRAEMEKDRGHQQQLAQMEHSARHAELVARHDQESALSLAAQRAELAERWRDERRQAHVVVIPQLETALELLETSMRKLTYDADGEPIRQESALNSLNNEVRAALASAIADVQIIASESARDMANRCQAALRKADVRIWVATHPTYPGSYTTADLKSAMSDARGALAGYVNSVRAELGTLQ